MCEGLDTKPLHISVQTFQKCFVINLRYIQCVEAIKLLLTEYNLLHSKLLWLISALLGDVVQLS